MKIDIVSGVEGAASAKGCAVVIDVYRAATVAAFALGNGARHIIPVATKQDAFALREKHPDYLLIGEEEGRLIPGFDYGNSPGAMTQEAVGGRILVQRTSAGVQGLMAATADEVLFGSFPTASAIARHIALLSPDTVTFVAMDGQETEDWFFAGYMAELITGTVPDSGATKRMLLAHPRSARFLDPDRPEFPEEDAHLALTADAFDFVCRLERTAGGRRLVRHTPELASKHRQSSGVR